MDVATNYTRDGSEPSLTCPDVVRKKRVKKPPRPQLLTRDMLDGRTNAAKAFDALVAAIESDLGGHDQLSAIELSLIEGFAGAYITLQNINCQIALGKAINISDQALSISAMVRVASRLGEQRRARDITEQRHSDPSPLREGLAP
jgi:hypothetical protein